MPIVSTLDRPDVVAVVPTMGGSPERLAACIQSMLDGSGAVRLAIVVIYNSSTTDAASLGRDDVLAVSAGLNLGWAGGIRFGADLTDSTYLWWMQDDVVVEPTALTALVATLDADRALACASPLHVEEGEVVAGSCGGVLTAEGAISHWLPVAACKPDDLPDLNLLSYRPSRALLVRREAFDAVGGPDPRLYPVQFVDVDFAHRLAATGLVGTTVLDAHIRHGLSASTPPPFAQFLHSRNAQRFSSVWYSQHPLPAEPYFPVYAVRPDPTSTPPLPLNPSISRDLVDAVAQSASDTLTHLGRVFSARAPDDRERLASVERQRVAETHRAAAAEAEIAALRASTSWRITAGLRWLARRLGRR